MKIASAGWEPSRRMVWVSLAGAATLVIAPWLLRGYKIGHDTYFHMNWWLEFAMQFREGILYPRWAELAYRGYGEPAFIFYPPLSLYAGGILTWLLSLHLALGTYVWLVMALSGFSSYYLCRQFFGPRAALLGSLVYVLNPYQLLEVHGRCSLSELLVGALLPLLLAAIYRLHESGKRGIAVVAVLSAAIALTSIPLAVLTAYCAFAFVLVLAITRKVRVETLAKFALAGLLGGGLAAFLLLPASIEKRWVLASMYSSFLPQTQLMPISVLVRWVPELPAVESALIVLGTIAWVLARKAQPRDAMRGFTVLFFGSMFMLLPISAVIWRFSPALAYVQFPWRLLGFMALAMSVFSAAAVQQSAKGTLFAVGVCTLGVAIIGAFTVLANRRADLSLSMLEDPFNSGHGYRGWAYVLPRDVKLEDVKSLKPGEPSFTTITPQAAEGTGAGAQADSQSDTRIAVTRWTAEARELAVVARQAVQIRFRLFRYPGWNAYVDGRPTDILSTDRRGAVIVQVPAGHSYVSLLYRRTADQTWGLVVSGLSLLIVSWMFLAGRGTHKTVLSTPERTREQVISLSS
jgi:hypothetical protein